MLEEEVTRLVADILNVGARSAAWSLDTPLLGHVPELDSFAVVAIINAIEDNFDLVVHDDEVSAETFATLGSLIDLIRDKLANG